MKKTAIALLVFVTTMVLISCGAETKSEQSNAEPAKDEKQEAQPKDPNAISFQVYDTKGTLRSSDEWIGKQPVVINFWGTWCPPCRAEMPALVEAYEEYKHKGVEFLGLAVGRDTPQTVNTYAAQNNVNWVMMMGGEGIMDIVKRYQIQSVPTTIFVDKNGKVMKIWSQHENRLVDKYVGILQHDQFIKMLDTLLTI